jgi:hypothetical protein
MRAMRFISIMVLLTAGACGGSSSTTLTGNNNNNNSSGPLSATIDGTAWSSQLPSAVVKNNIVAIAGIDNALTTTVTIGFGALNGPGTYSLGFGNSNAGSGIVIKSGKSWGSSLQGGTGSVTLTTLTANHVVGTFTFSAPASGGGATGTSSVTNGKFDITF